MAAGKRTFTHEIQAGISGAAGVNTTVLAAAQFVAQEDIKIVGVQLLVQQDTMLGNDGDAELWGELSQNGDRFQPGMIVQGGAISWWNTAPAAVGTIKGSEIIMFPAGHEISLREEGVLYLHTTAYATRLSAGTANGSAHALIFYQKA